MIGFQSRVGQTHGIPRRRRERSAASNLIWTNSRISYLWGLEILRDRLKSEEDPD